MLPSGPARLPDRTALQTAIQALRLGLKPEAGMGRHGPALRGCGVAAG